MRKQIFALLFIVHCLMFIANCYAQQPTQEWAQHFTGYGYADGLSVKLDSLGNVYVLTHQSGPAFGSYYGLLKYSSSGNLIWNVIYNFDSTTDGNVPMAFDVTTSGNVYITGNGGTVSSNSIVTVKFSNTGVLQWARVIPNAGANDIKVDRSGNAIVCGSIGDGSISDSYIVKYDSTGDTLFTRKFRRAVNSSGLVKLLLDDSDNIYGCGDDAADYLVLKYNSAGKLVWYANWTSTPNYQDFITVAAIDMQRNVYAVGTTYHPFGFGYSNTLVKFGNNGTVVWASTFNGIMGSDTSSGIPAGIAVSSDGFSVYYTTYGYSPGPEFTDIVTLKYNSVGDSEWVRKYPGGSVTGGDNVPAAVFLDKYNNVYIAGNGQFPTTGNDFATVKYSPTGTQQWVMTYNGPLSNSDDQVNSIWLDSNYNVYITGISSRQNSPFLWDAATIKYSQPIGIENISSNFPGSFKLEQNYPNPFNPSTTIKYAVPQPVKVSIKIYDILGRLVKTLVNDEFKDIGFYEVKLDASNFASGVYFYRIEAGKFVQSKKMVVLK